MSSMFCAGLIEMPPESKCDALADERHRRCFTGAAMLQHDEARLLVAALGHGEQRPILPAQLGPIEHREREAVCWSASCFARSER